MWQITIPLTHCYCLIPYFSRQVIIQNKKSNRAYPRIHDVTTYIQDKYWDTLKLHTIY